MAGTLPSILDLSSEIGSSSVAVRSWDGSFTYDELRQRVSDFANNLQAAGIGHGDPVGLCVEKSRLAVVAIVAILKCGGICVPLEIQHPTTRLLHVLRSAQTTYVVTDRKNNHRFAGSNVQVLHLDFLASETHRTENKTQPTCALPSDIAFLMFTSGSTGNPKGIVQTHEALYRKVRCIAGSTMLRQDSRLFQFASYSFDVSIGDIFCAFYAGCMLCIPSEDGRVNDLARAMQDVGTTHVFLTPTTASQVHPSTVHSLQFLVLGGESLTPSLIQDWSAQVTLCNIYGTTETCIWDTIKIGVDQNTEPGNIGHSIGPFTMVVDPDNIHVLLEDGTPGELLIGGDFLAKEYLNDPAGTNVSFFCLEPLHRLDAGDAKARFYRTGDIARRNRDGTLTLLGRKDCQVKMRGQRFELGEVDGHFSRLFPENNVVSDVLTIDAEKKNQSLVVYVSMGSTSSGELLWGSEAILRKLYHMADTARRTLSATLPSYMIPSIFIPISGIPLNASGKTDRRKLKTLAAALTPTQIAAFRQVDRSKRAPSTDKEVLMRTLWSGVLGLAEDDIGADDHFFRLGGDSISAMKMVSLARASRVSLTVADVFRQPVLSELCSLTHWIEAAPDGSRGYESSTVAPFALIDKSETVISAAAMQCQISRGMIEDIYPCTTLQEGLMLLSIKRPGSYIAREVFELPEDTDVARFQQAWDAVVRANPIWRTRLVQLDTLGTFQVVMAEPITWQYTGTVSGFFEQESRMRMGFGESLFELALAQPSDLRQPSLIMTAHHALYDGWSLSETFAQVHDTYMQGSPARMLPFNLFVQQIEQADSGESRKFWSSYLSGFEPTAFPRGCTAQTESNPDTEIVVPFHWTRPLESDFTSSTFLRTAWALLVGAYTASNDVVFGMTLNGRSSLEADASHILGPTITTVPVRIRLERSSKVFNVLSEVQGSASLESKHEHYGLQNIQRIDPAVAEICRFTNVLIINLDSSLDNVPTSFGLHREELTDQSDFNSYPLMIECTTSPDQITVTANFDSTMIDLLLVRQMIQQFEHLLHELSSCTSPDTQVRSLSMVSPQDLSTIRTRNASSIDLVERCSHDLFAEQALQRPDAPAVCAWDGDLCYRELDHLSTTLACKLAKLGVGPEVMVPICFEKSKWVVVAMLAILKSGGAFVPLDPKCPPERLSYICKQVGACIALTSAQHRSKFSGILETSLIVDSSAVAHTCAEVPNLAGRSQPCNAMYVIFTSGSTGVPKGCVNEHQAYVTAALLVAQAKLVSKSSRYFQFSAYSFDVAIEEIFTTLLVGGCICIPSEEERVNNLAAAIGRYKATLADLTPSVASLLDFCLMPLLQTVVLGGEPITRPLSNRLQSPVTFINTYGLSETAITNVVANPVSMSNTQNIGFPVNCRCWITDPEDYHSLMPLGAAGELLLEGPALCREYLNAPDLTARAFVSDPAWLPHFSGPTKGRFYRTGDIVRYNSHGELEFIGRKDTQVKIRGQRIDLSEVEVQLQVCAPERKFVVLAPENHEQTKVLVALTSHTFGVASDASHSGADLQLDQSLHTDALNELNGVVRARLLQILPTYMVPSVFFCLSYIPLTSSGKVDRVSLKGHARVLLSNALSRVPDIEKRSPGNQKERMMRSLWARVLGIDEKSIGLDDNFFRLGGDSISAMRLVALARKNEIRLSVADIFKFPILMSMPKATAGPVLERNILLPTESSDQLLLKDQVSTALHAYSSSSDPPPNKILAVSEATDFQAFALAHNQLQSRGFVNYFTFWYDQQVDVNEVQESWRQVVENHEVLRTVFAISAKKVYQLLLASYSLPFTVLNQQLVNNDHVQSVIRLQMEEPLWFHEPMLKFTLLNSPNGSCLIARISHAQYDGISLPGVFKDLQAICQGQPVARQPSMFAYMECVQALDVRAAEMYWTNLLSGSEMTAMCQPNGPDRFAKSDSRVFRNIPKFSADSMEFTFATILKASWAVLLGAMAARTDVVFGHLTSGRNVPIDSIEDVAGPCINIIPVRLNLEGTLRDVLLRTRTQQVDALEHEHLGMSHMRRTCTSWAPQTRFSSVVQHQNLDEVFETMVVHGTACKIGESVAPANAADAWIISTPRENEIEVAFGFNSETIPIASADLILERLCRVIGDVRKDPDQPVSEILGCTTELPSIPMPVPQLDTTVPEDSFYHQYCSVCDTVTRQVWWLTFGPICNFERQIFENWDDLCVAAQMAALFRGKGVHLDMEVIMRNPTFEGQRSMVHGKGKICQHLGQV
jgi:amino acid adenylation domain-containing protein